MDRRIERKTKQTVARWGIPPTHYYTIPVPTVPVQISIGERPEVRDRHRRGVF